MNEEPELPDDPAQLRLILEAERAVSERHAEEYDVRIAGLIARQDVLMANVRTLEEQLQKCLAAK